MDSHAFERAFQRLIEVEKGYANNPKDAGGKTRWGVTERNARAAGYIGPMSEFPIERARTFYYDQYWALMRLEHLARLSDTITQEVFDTAVHTNQAFAAKSLQRCLNLLNRNEDVYADVEVDGLIGLHTRNALSLLQTLRGCEGERVLATMLNSLQGAYYIDRGEKRVENEEFMYGWFLNRVVIPQG